MRTFACERCGQLVFFENTTCLNCGAPLGFRWEDREILTFHEDPSGGPPRAGDGRAYVRCANAGIAGCNWRVEEGAGPLCVSCALTRTRPADGDAAGLAAFAGAEAAKRRLLFELGELGLPLDGLAFDLLSSRSSPVTTGHADGLITLDLAEEDDAHRERMRAQMGEPYRTLLGHFRHEVGHFYWSVLVHDDGTRERARALFGDERADYRAALERHYEHGPRRDWAEEFVSAYATMHPAEDWAETFAHYLHIRDTAQTAAAYRMRVGGPTPTYGPRRAATRALTFEPGAAWAGIDELLDDWLPLTYALNALNRSMGYEDLYPFVLTEPAIAKLVFVDGLVRGEPRG